MSDSKGKNTSAFAAMAVAIGTILTTLADIAGIVQLQDASFLIIIVVLTLAAIVLALYALVSRKNHEKTTSSWLAAGAMICALVALGVAATSVVKGETSDQKDSSTTSSQPTTQTMPPSKTDKKITPPLFEGEIKLWLGMGVDVDAASPKAVTTTAAAGVIDVAAMYYGNLQAAGKGFYHIQNGEDAESACRSQLASERPAQKEVAGLAGQEYCLQTSSGKTAWVKTVDSTILSIQSDDRYVTIAVKIWPY